MGGEDLPRAQKWRRRKLESSQQGSRFGNEQQPWSHWSLQRDWNHQEPEIGRSFRNDLALGNILYLLVYLILFWHTSWIWIIRLRSSQLPLLDDMVDTLMSRDSDSVIITREQDAVQEWLAYNKTFHIIRDHPHHCSFFLGGGCWWLYYFYEFQLNKSFRAFNNWVINLNGVISQSNLAISLYIAYV